MKKIMSSILLINFISIAAPTHNMASFLSQSQPIKLSAFMDLVQLQDKARDEFFSYYKETVDGMRGMRLAKKESQLQKLQQLGMNSLEIKHPQWAREITHLLDKNNSLYNNARTFLVRFASLELYFEQKAREKNSILAKVRGFFNQARETVAGWTFSLRPKQKVV